MPDEQMEGKFPEELPVFPCGGFDEHARARARALYFRYFTDDDYDNDEDEDTATRSREGRLRKVHRAE